MARKPEITHKLYSPVHGIGVGNLLTQAYDGPAQAQLVQAMRSSGDMVVELMALHEESVVGYVGFSRHLSPQGWMALSPLGVLPAWRSHGIGAELVRYGLDHARRAGAKAVTVLGDGRYYQRFGFTYRAAENLETPYSSEKTLLFPIAPGTAFSEEKLVYSPAFRELGLEPTN
ncbi:putative acetyltransferase [Pseudooceanicola antarcticus]|uniref:N-acetyltransferase n=1 Tax=Pseudooceanicola antarcticus TaxID=1247613 RepID=A0A285III1_9RHOB|nr:N-acetyltransferase [Pseudooceanicola antarcticus]PJE28899.1 N-acetyltransferase [Pseudooceanicola antarcticus]SNY47785.1 putative acetyltransferase [Pseudooceanicola antarcticus]